MNAQLYMNYMFILQGHATRWVFSCAGVFVTHVVLAVSACPMWYLQRKKFLVSEVVVSQEIMAAYTVGGKKWGQGKGQSGVGTVISIVVNMQERMVGKSMPPELTTCTTAANTPCEKPNSVEVGKDQFFELGQLPSECTRWKSDL